MTIEWQVTEAESDLPTLDDGPPPSFLRRWGLLIALLLLVAGSAGGWLGTQWWRARQNETLLREELTAHIRAETQAQSFGLQDEVDTFLSPTAPRPWRATYASLFAYDRVPREAYLDQLPLLSDWVVPDVLPRIGEMRLDESGTKVEAEVIWEGRSTVTEWRTYQYADGQWGRVPSRWPIGDTALPLRTRASEHFIFQAAEPQFSDMGEGAELLDLLEQYHRHLVATWPAETINRLSYQIVVKVEPRDLQPLFIRNLPYSEIILNDPTLALPYPDLPYGPETQLKVTAVLASSASWLNNRFYRLPLGLPQDDNAAPVFFYQLLPETEVYQLVLTDDERDYLRQVWREELNGEWVSPFVSPNSPENLRSGEHGENVNRWMLSMRLFLDQMEVEYGLTPGAIVTAMHTSTFTDAPEGMMQVQTLGEHFAAMTGLSIEELEARAEAYAAMP